MNRKKNSKPVTIFIIDDNCSEAAIVADIFELEKLRWAIELHCDPSSAARALEENVKLGKVPNLVLLDLHLPGKNGLEILREIRSNPKTRNVFVIMFTTCEDPAYAEAAYESGADGYLIKPSSLDEYRNLSDIIKSLVKARFRKAG